MFNKNTVGTRNEAKVGKNRIIPYCEFFPYCESFPYSESNSFTKSNFGQHQHSVIASFYTIAESLIASSNYIFKANNIFEQKFCYLLL